MRLLLTISILLLFTHSKGNVKYDSIPAKDYVNVSRFIYKYHPANGHAYSLSPTKGAVLGNHRSIMAGNQAGDTFAFFLIVPEALKDRKLLFELPPQFTRLLILDIGREKPVAIDSFVLSDVKNQPFNQINFNLPGKDTIALAFVVESEFIRQFKVSIASRVVMHKKVETSKILFSIYLGIVLVMILYNFFIFLFTRDLTYLLYVTYIIAVGFTQLSIFGFTARYFWPENTWLQLHSVNIFTSLVGIASLEFIKSFLKTRVNFPKFHHKFIVIHIIYIVAVIISFSGFIPLAYNINSVNATILSLLTVYIAYKSIQSGYKPAMFFLVAWVIFILGVVLYIMKDFGILEVDFISNYTMPIGSALETVILSLALADRINTLKKEKEESQAQALMEMQKNQRLIREQNIVLEQKVKERTAELEKTLSDLKEAQQQLIDSEKMASLGQLTAGIAHEINNPINFVSSNIEPLKADIHDVIHLLTLYKDRVMQLNPSDFSNALEYEREIDLEYTISEIDHLMNGIREGASRTTEIVSSLRTFSRQDDSTFVPSDLHEIIESSLTILKNNLGKIKIEKHFGDVPIIDVYPGKLNQVFINVLNNAIQAILDKYEYSEDGLIEIKTETSDEKVMITIHDNGPGIPEDIVSKIFDPFFTTKDVGKGTGLGLSITFGIIEQHKGKIYVRSDMREGATMIIELPIRHK